MLARPAIPLAAGLLRDELSRSMRMRPCFFNHILTIWRRVGPARLGPLFAVCWRR